MIEVKLPAASVPVPSRIGHNSPLTLSVLKGTSYEGSYVHALVEPALVGDGRSRGMIL